MKKKFIPTLTGILAIALAAILLLVLFLNVSTLRSVGEIKRGGQVKDGYFCAIVGSGSMEPAVHVNDWLLVEGGGSYRAGDIITYVSTQGGLVTHRIREVSGNGYITQGDANNVSDGEISRQRVLGKVVFVLPGAGWLMDGLLSPVGIALLVCVCALVWLIRGIRREVNEEVQHSAEASFDNTPEQ